MPGNGHTELYMLDSPEAKAMSNEITPEYACYCNKL